MNERDCHEKFEYHDGHIRLNAREVISDLCDGDSKGILKGIRIECR